MATVIDDLLVNLGFDADTTGAHQFSASLNNVLGTIGKISGAVALASGAVAGFLGKGILDTASEFEQFETQLTTIEGSADKARKSLDWIADFGAKTPYDISQVTEAFVKLKSYGLDPIKGNLLESLGNTASAMGKTLDQAAEMMADAVRGENERLKEFGIVGSKEKQTTTFSYDINGESLAKTVGNGSAEIQQALQDIMDEKFRGGMERMSKTWEGTLSNLGDTWGMLKKRVADGGIFDRVKQGLNDVMLLIYDNRDAIDAWADRIGKKLVDAWDKVLPILFDLWDKVMWVIHSLKQLSDQFGITKYKGEIFAGIIALITANLVGLLALKAVAFVMALGKAFMLLFSPMALIVIWLSLFALGIQDIYNHLNGKESLFGDMLKKFPAIAAMINFVVDNFKLILIIVGVLIAAYALMKAAAIANFLISMAAAAAYYGFVLAWSAIYYATVIGYYIAMAAGAVSAGLATAAAWMLAFAPFLLIAAIVAGVIALFWLLYKNWDDIWQGINDITSGIIDGIKGMISGLIEGVSNALSKIKELMFSKPVEMILNAVKFVKTKFTGDEGDTKDTVNSSTSVSGMDAIRDRTPIQVNNQNQAPQSTVTQHINVASASEAATVANRTAQGSRQQSYGYQ